MRDDAAWLLDMKIAACDALEFIQGVSYEDFQSNRILQHALCMTLDIVGEAARKVSDGFKAIHPEIPWRQIVSLRHRIAHEYFRLDLQIIWGVLTKELDPLVKLLEPLIPPDDSTEG